MHEHRYQMYKREPLIGWISIDIVAPESTGEGILNTPTVTTLKSPRKRRQLATSIWQFARGPLPYLQRQESNIAA